MAKNQSKIFLNHQQGASTLKMYYVMQKMSLLILGNTMAKNPSERFLNHQKGA